MSAAGPKESVESTAREPDLDIYDKLRRFDEKIKELEARLAPRVPPAQTETDLPCPHARPSWRMCPHCLGVNAAEPPPEELRECEGCGQRKPLEEMAVCFLPGTGGSYQCEQCRGGP